MYFNFKNLIFIVLTLSTFGCKNNTEITTEIIRAGYFVSADGALGGKELQLLDSKADRDMYLELASIKQIDGALVASTITNLKGELLEKFKAERGVSSTKILSEFDCQNNSQRMLVVTVYEKLMAVGSAKSSEKVNDNWERFEGTETGKFTLDIVCQKAKTNIESTKSTAALVESAATPSPISSPEPTPSPTAATTTVNVADNSPFAPSFDCAKASNMQEKLVCSDRELSKMDVELSQAYSLSKEKTSDKESLRKTQMEWIRQAFRSCSDKSCLVSAYKTRISELQK